MKYFRHKSDGSVPIITVNLRPNDFDEKPIIFNYFFPEEIRGEISIRIGDCVITRGIAPSSDGVIDAVYCILIEFHEFIHTMYDLDSAHPWDPLRKEISIGRWGMKFFYQKNALTITWNNHDDAIEIFFFTQGSKTGPVIPPAVRKEDFIMAVQSATGELIHQIEHHINRRGHVKEYIRILQHHSLTTDKILREIRKPATPSSS
jgi:hypothetical protein